MSEEERLVTPDDPDFEGARWISQEAMVQQKVAEMRWLQGVAWTWRRWWPERDDHDHCVICHEAAFSETYDRDLREGWRSEDPSWDSPAWLCPRCFDRFRERFDWRIQT